MRFLGFNKQAQPGSSAHIELSISLDEVLRLPNVDKQSTVMPDDIRRLGDSGSIAWSRAKSLGPYDVINIDLCAGIASDPPQGNRPLYDALALLLALQSRNHTPWLLLITTRVGRGMFDAEAEGRIIKLFRENLANCEGFHEECQRTLKLDPMSACPERCNDIDLLNLMIVAIGKWLAALAQVQGRSVVDLASTHGYKVNPGAPCEDLISIALRFKPLIEASADPLSPSQPTSTTECDNAKRILKGSVRRINVDTVLAEDPGLNEELIEETTRLLAQARFDITPYRTWLMS
jgi:hypothetical protein